MVCSSSVPAPRGNGVRTPPAAAEPGIPPFLSSNVIMKTHEQTKRIIVGKSLLVTALAVWANATFDGRAQETGPRILHPHLSVRTVTTNLSQPTGLAFLATNDLF